MLLTEDEAKEMWCPFARYSSGTAAANRWKQSEPTPHALNPVPCRCIASECMAWRWKDQPPENKVAGEDSWRGFCGLAGQVS